MKFQRMIDAHLLTSHPSLPWPEYLIPFIRRETDILKTSSVNQSVPHIDFRPKIQMPPRSSFVTARVFSAVQRMESHQCMSHFVTFKVQRAVYIVEILHKQLTLIIMATTGVRLRYLTPWTFTILKSSPSHRGGSQGQLDRRPPSQRYPGLRHTRNWRRNSSPQIPSTPTAL